MHRVLKDIIGSSRGGFNRVIVRIHHAIVMQIDEIKGSLNLCLTKRPTDFEPPWMREEVSLIFSRLFYVVSDKCLDHLRASYRRLEKDDFEEECTDWWVEECLGLPCIHKIAMAIITRTPLDPMDIDVFWRKLSWEDGSTPYGSVDDGLAGMTIPEIRLREMWLKLQSGTLKQGTAYQLGELYTELEYPEQSTMMEPTKDDNKKGKGRPRGARDKDKGDGREKSHFEHMQEELIRIEKQKDKQQGSESQTRRPGRPRKEKVIIPEEVIDCDDIPSQPVEEYSTECAGPKEHIVHMGVNFGCENVDDFWFRYIVYVTDVMADGHCGYRSAAVLLGLDQMDYRRVRKDLVSELVQNSDLYEPMRRGLREGTWADLLRQVNHVASPCGPEFWWHMPLIGLIFATCYQVGLVLLTWHAPMLCLPLRWRSMTPGIPRVNLGIAHIGHHDHFVPVINIEIIFFIKICCICNSPPFVVGRSA